MKNTLKSKHLLNSKRGSELINTLLVIMILIVCMIMLNAFSRSFAYITINKVGSVIGNM